MALNIGGATIGYDANNVQQALNNINITCIMDTINLMNRSMSGLRSSVDRVWVGQSAENFKNNMEIEKDKVARGLEDSFQLLESEFRNIVNEMAAMDNELIEKRG